MTEKRRLRDLHPMLNHVLVRLLPQDEVVTASGILAKAISPPDYLSPDALVIRKGICTEEKFQRLMDSVEVGDMVRLAPASGVRDCDDGEGEYYAVVFIGSLLGVYKPDMGEE